MNPGMWRCEAYAPDESNQRRQYASVKILNSMFLTLMKKALMGSIEGRHKTSLSLAIIRSSALTFWGRFFLAPYVCDYGPNENISPTPNKGISP